MSVNFINNQIFPNYKKLGLLDAGFHDYNYFFRRFTIVCRTIGFVTIGYQGILCNGPYLAR
jgi:hypothetical protein